MLSKNNTSPVTGVLFENEDLDGAHMTPNSVNHGIKQEICKREMNWIIVFAVCYTHTAGLYGLYLAVTSAQFITTLFAIIMYWVGQIGITAGTHRLFSHRSYKATWQLRLLLMLMDSSASQGKIFQWVRDHRVHHKYSETNADPHNAKRGFFYSHVGWVLLRRHPETTEKGKGIDLSDLTEDPIVCFQKKYYWIIMPLMCIVLPTVIPVYFWQETWMNAYHVASALRFILILNSTWLINSAAHLYGNKPYDRFMNPSENKFVSIMATGEGWHNYHHTFPWDYKAAELGDHKYNFATAFIDFFAKIGWAYDLKTVSKDMIQKRVKRTGDGSHQIWGVNDKQLRER
ncbi:hypothetical protein QAD02_015931 [Eretmocerus hayati]|uniref:Uncharacterized protein n=1 Tax=Eretmocerus hayati TaxID=131215 RepID=A0ACC2PA14_9HYME|nr:hypothetical protein QAD02_015931 [Eretmocerus hayati]